MSQFIRKIHPVQEPDKTGTYGHSSARAKTFDITASNVLLVGLRASGKTSLGRRLAEALGATFVDTDTLIVDRIGQGIDAFVASQGWESFRKVEHDVFQEVCQGRGQVVATGGGIVLRPDNRELLKGCGQVFYLMSDVGTLRGRLERDPQHASRPSLTGRPIGEELVQLLNEREPLYMACANHVLQAHKPIAELVDDVLVALGLKASMEELDLPEDF